MKLYTGRANTVAKRSFRRRNGASNERYDVLGICLAVLLRDHVSKKWQMRPYFRPRILYRPRDYGRTQVYRATMWELVRCDTEFASMPNKRDTRLDVPIACRKE